MSTSRPQPCTAERGLRTWRIVILITCGWFGIVGARATAVAGETGPASPVGDGGRFVHGLSVRDGGLWLRGRRYRGIGVNQADLFQRVIHEPQPQEAASLADLRFLGRKKIPFVRFWCCGFWPVDWKLYRENRAEWFSRLDRVVRAAEEADVGLVACLFWRPETVSDLCDEFTSSWADPESRTRQFMATYTREVVERYRDSPAIWSWEFANEWNAECDLPNGMEFLGRVAPDLGVNRAKDPRNLVTTEIAAAAMQAFATEVRRHDLHRCISSGNAQPRASAWHQASEGSWAGDDAAQVRDMFRRHNPAPIDLASIHIYPATAPLRLGGRVGTRPVLELLKAAASTAGQPLFVGEFSAGGGHTGPADISMEEFRREQTEILAAIVESEVDLAAHWVFALDRDRAGPGLVRPGNEYEWVLDQIVEHNARLAAGVSERGRPHERPSTPSTMAR